MAGEDAAGGQAGAVEGVEELRLAGGLPQEAHVAPAGLVIPGRWTRRRPPCTPAWRDLDLNVVGPSHGGRAVPSGQLHGAEVEAQALHQVLRLGDQLVEGVVGVLGAGELEHLYLIKLMAPDHALPSARAEPASPPEAGV